MAKTLVDDKPAWRTGLNQPFENADRTYAALPDVTMSSSGANHAIPHSTQDLITVLERAAQARAEHDDAKAFAYYSRAIEIDPNRAEAWAGRADTSSRLDDALLSWAYACALSPTDSNFSTAMQKRVEEKIATSTFDQTASLTWLARAMAEVGLTSPAYRLVKRASELDERDQDAWLWRAGLTTDRRETVACLNHVLALNPGNTRAQAGLQWARASQSRSRDSSSADVKAAAELVTAGRELLPNGNKERAHAIFKRATEMDPTSAEAWLWRAGTAAEIDEALMCIEEALTIAPENRSALEARSWLRVKKLRQSMQTHATVPDLHRKSPALAPPVSARAGSHRLRNVLVLLVTALAVFLVAVVVILLHQVI